MFQEHEAGHLPARNEFLRGTRAASLVATLPAHLRGNRRRRSQHDGQRCNQPRGHHAPLLELVAQKKRKRNKTWIRSAAFGSLDPAHSAQLQLGRCSRYCWSGRATRKSTMSTTDSSRQTRRSIRRGTDTGSENLALAPRPRSTLQLVFLSRNNSGVLLAFYWQDQHEGQISPALDELHATARRQLLRQLSPSGAGPLHMKAG